MSKRKIKVGLPIGSLNDFSPNRGCTYELLTKYAGLHVEGYYPGKAIPNPKIKEFDDILEFYTNKPSQLIRELESEELDFIIGGSDQILEQDLSWKIYQNLLNQYYPTDLREKLTLQISQNSTVALEELWKNWKGFSLTRNPTYHSKLNELINLEEREINAKNYISQFLDESKLPIDLSRWGRRSIGLLKLVADLGYGAVDLHWQTKEDISELKNKLSHRYKIGENRQGAAYFAMNSDKIKVAAEYPAIAYADLMMFMFPEFIGVEIGKFYMRKFSDSIKQEDSQIELLKRLAAEQKTKNSNLKPIANYFLASIQDRPHRNEIKLEANYDLCLGSVSSGDSLRREKVIAFGEPVHRSSVGIYGFSPLSDSYEDFKSIMELKEINPRFNEFIHLLKEASIKYGKERKDSRWHPEFGAWRKNGNIYQPYLEV